MIVTQTKVFAKKKKKLHKKQIKDLDAAIQEILKKPQIGSMKKGDLFSVRVYKFKSASQEYLLAYQEQENGILLLMIGSHENFYRDLKNNVNN